jgi:hypothetical protein
MLQKKACLAEFPGKALFDINSSLMKIVTALLYFKSRKAYLRTEDGALISHSSTISPLL